MRIGLVVPRFGERLVGGAEMHARQLAERLQRAGHDIEIVTTCALDHHTWRNELPPGQSVVGDLRVLRFPADNRDLGIHGEMERAITHGFPLSVEEELLWLRHGVSSSAMEEYLASSPTRYDVVLAMPYLFGTTYFASVAAASPFVVIPCLHDEAYARLAFVRSMLENATGVLFNAHPESDLGLRLAPEIARWEVVGMGFDPDPPQPPSVFRSKHGVEGPILLYVGRREGGKNTPLLIDHFMRYKHRRAGSDLQLVLVGSGEPVPKHPAIHAIEIDWSYRDSMYRAATIFCQPSTNESLSIVVMQAWLAQRAVVVHADCAVTVDHCRRSNGGVWFRSYAEFEAIVDRLVGDEPLRRTLGESGRRWVGETYSWESVLDRFDRAVGSWVGSEAVASGS